MHPAFRDFNHPLREAFATPRPELPAFFKISEVPVNGLHDLVNSLSLRRNGAEHGRGPLPCRVVSRVLTRNPRGLEQALAKISCDREVLEVANRATQHLFFTNPIKKFEDRSSSMFSTHPNIVDRINRLRQLTGEPPLGAGDVQALAGLD